MEFGGCFMVIFPYIWEALWNLNLKPLHNSVLSNGNQLIFGWLGLWWALEWTWPSQRRLSRVCCWHCLKINYFSQISALLIFFIAFTPIKATSWYWKKKNMRDWIATYTLIAIMSTCFPIRVDVDGTDEEGSDSKPKDRNIPSLIHIA